MPGQDQTGPTGAGPMTGRKRGRCAEEENTTPAGRGFGRGEGCRQGRGQGGGRGRNRGQR